MTPTIFILVGLAILLGLSIGVLMERYVIKGMQGSKPVKKT